MAQATGEGAEIYGGGSAFLWLADDEPSQIALQRGGDLGGELGADIGIPTIEDVADGNVTDAHLTGEIRGREVGRGQGLVESRGEGLHN